MEIGIKFFLYAVFVIACQSVFSLPGDFLLLAVIFFGLEFPLWLGFAMASLFGMFLDVASWSPFGAHIFSFGITFLLIATLRGKMVLQSLATRFVAILGFSLFHGLLFFGWCALFNYFHQAFAIYARELLIAMLVNSLLGVFWLPCLRFFSNFEVLQLFSKKKITFRKESPWS